jgi:hydroxymethylbilane synthase
LNTRLRKLDTLRQSEAADSEHVYSVLILAAAGLHRLGWQSRTTGYLSRAVCLHAVGQGALAIECRDNDPRTLACLRQLEHAGTHVCVEAERAVMRTLEGGCSVPIGVWTEITPAEQLRQSGPASGLDADLTEYRSLLGAQLTLHAIVVSVDGKTQAAGMRHAVLEGVQSDQCAVQLREQAARLGRELAQELKLRGADEILRTIQR